MLHQLAMFLGGALIVASTQSQYPHCTTQSRTAVFYSCSLTHIPAVPGNITKFLLSFNYIVEVNATSFPLLEQLVYLELGSQRTERLTVRKDAFKNLPNLSVLDLGDNKMLLLDPDAFAGLFNLTVLLLYYNQLDGSILENDYFRDLASLEFLDLSKNKITYLKPHPLFYFLNKFSLLNLQLNQIATICEGDLHSFQRKHFRVFDLSSNNLYRSYTIDWDKCGNPFRNIVFDTLILSGNGFGVNKTQHFCKAIKGTTFFQLKLGSHTMGAGFGYNNLKDPDKETFANLAESDLKILDLSSGYIFSLNPHVFASLTQLQLLKLENNKVNAIQRQAFYGLNELQILNLSQNLLGELYDYTFDGLPNVTQILLQKNHIGAIQPNAFKGLTKLTHLDLQDNALKTVYFCLTMSFTEMIVLRGNKLSKLEVQMSASYIDASENRLEDLGNLYLLLQVPSVVYIILKQNYLSFCYKGHNISTDNQLKYLDLSENVLQVVWDTGKCLDVFRELSMLQVLDLNKNYLKFLPGDIFIGLTSLKKLNLSSNRLTYLPNGIFPQTLEKLDLSGNQLMSPDPDLFTFLRVLDITNNRFICDCSLSELILWLNHTNTTLLGSRDDISCVFPGSMMDVPLHSITTGNCMEENLEHLMFSLFVFTSVILILFIITVIICMHFRGYTFFLYRKIISIIMNDLPRERDDTDACRYDAYVCYSSKDFEWVQHALLKHLDSQYCDKNRFNVCFEERDFIPGEDHIINIRDAIWNSKKTICIVTKHFLRDGWCVEALNYAQSRYYSELKDVLIVVVVGALSQYQLSKFKPIRAFLQRRQYLKWPEDLQDIDWFFYRLSQKILKEQLAEKKTLNVSTQTSRLELTNIATIS